MRFLLSLPMLVLTVAPALARVDLEEVAWENFWMGTVPTILQLLRFPWL
jgi:hypothetical protein